MKILLVSLNHTPEQIGVGKFQGEMAAWFAARGHQVRAVAAPPYYPSWKIGKGYSSWHYKVEEIDGVRVYRVPLYVPSRRSGIRRLMHLLSFAVTSSPVILGQAVMWRPDVIIVTAPPLMAAPAVLLAGLISRTRAHMHVHDFEVDAAFNLGLLNKNWLFRYALSVENGLLRCFSSVSSITPRMRDRLLAKGVAQKRVSLVPNWAGTGNFNVEQGAGAWLERLKPDPETVVALYSGNLGRKQRLDVVIEAARRLQNESHIRFVISGDGVQREELMINAAGLTNVIFLPVQPFQDFIQLMVAADIHLLPQKAEAADLMMPSKLGNILASGKPVIASANPGTQIFEAIEGCGIAVTPDSVEELVRAILTLARDKNLREEMGIAGRRRAQDEWSKDNILLKFESFLDQTTSERRAIGSY